MRSAHIDAALVALKTDLGTIRQEIARLESLKADEVATAARLEALTKAREVFGVISLEGNVNSKAKAMVAKG